MQVGSMTGTPLVYLLLHEAKPSGLAIGKMGQETIYEFVTDSFGRRYRYNGVAPRRWSGEIDVDALKPGEFILAPCLVYRMEVHEAAGGILAAVRRTIMRALHHKSDGTAGNRHHIGS